MFRISEGVVFRELDGEAVLLNLDSGMYYGLDGVGTRIWRLLEEHGRPEPVAAALFDEYDVPLDTAQRDVERLLTTLIEKGLVTETADGLAGR